ncbi:hypothetical protein BU24DRAFT_352891 [Aaosphaeria arxii CBS 175.79]|uniref:Uncharacterized protein n=1 Tax=Aaosphaeria arxii CBS 175.79 TaxID=1450172 RepID=A0A6A5XFE3_9PLEO|nr:uncharacterized protein BU24DRAFT_352891 [Aaosphaeria arxii CBS 175.79]KAF2011965.1 hypothetical protein BU24DRAFT_352891 [Aaosphaeria arxii CBS 175.79]
MRVKREVPQEHAHENILRAVNVLLQLDNPDNIQDAVFGLLGNAAAAQGIGNIADPDCLHQATADQAFTNAKAAGDVDGMTNALIFRALERNTGSVGLKSVLCESIKAVNPEIAALTQHQDPASDGAAELNKQITTELARQIAAIGGDPLLANEASTFAPGEIGDPTGAGNTCDDADDAAGCINSLGLRVDDLTEDEILAAVADVAGAGAGNATGNANANNNTGNACNAGNAGNANKGKGNANLGNANVGKGNANVGNANVGNANAGLLQNCNAAINFGATSDGRKEDAFEPADLSLFNHGSAQNIGIISSFICQQISNRCDVGASIATTCQSAIQASTGLVGAAAANAFNAALGL